MNYIVGHAQVTHHFMEKPQDEFFGNQSKDTLVISDGKLKGYYTTCSSGEGYLDWKHSKLGPFVWCKGPAYGWIKKYKHIGFTAKTYGFRLFNKYEIHFGKSYNFAATKSGGRGYGLMIIWFSLRPSKESLKVPSVQEALSFSEKLEIDPHLKKK